MHYVTFSISASIMTFPLSSFSVWASLLWMTQRRKHSFTVSSLKICIEEKKALHTGRLGHLLREGRMTHLICVSIRQPIHLFLARFSLLVLGFSAVSHLFWQQAVENLAENVDIIVRASKQHVNLLEITYFSQPQTLNLKNEFDILSCSFQLKHVYMLKQ